MCAVNMLIKRNKTKTKPLPQSKIGDTGIEPKCRKEAGGGGTKNTKNKHKSQINLVETNKWKY